MAVAGLWKDETARGRARKARPQVAPGRVHFGEEAACMVSRVRIAPQMRGLQVLVLVVVLFVEAAAPAAHPATARQRRKHESERPAPGHSV